MAKRLDLIPKYCNRCGNDLMTGTSVLHLPFDKKYISLCVVCTKGLGIDTLFVSKNPTKENWNDFWEEVINE